MIVAMSASAQIVMWTCFVVGVVLLLSGVVIGLYLTFTAAVTSTATSAQASGKVEQAKEAVETLMTTAVDAAQTPQTSPEAEKTAAVAGNTAKSALDEIGAIVSSLPENLRFAGLLVLVGTVLMSVATVQFGGHSLF
jgi:hypothetical protein